MNDKLQAKQLRTIAFIFMILIGLCVDKKG
jgi:hypothetical protein